MQSLSEITRKPDGIDNVAGGDVTFESRAAGGHADVVALRLQMTREITPNEAAAAEYGEFHLIHLIWRRHFRQSNGMLSSVNFLPRAPDGMRI